MTLKPSYKFETDQDILDFVQTLGSNVKEKILEALQNKKLDDNENQEKISFASDLFSIESDKWIEKEFTGNNGKSIVAQQTPDGNVIQTVEKNGQLMQVFAKDVFLDYIASANGCTPQEAKEKYFLDKDVLDKKLHGMFKNGSYREFYMKIKKNNTFFANNDKVCGSGSYFFFWLADGSIAMLDMYGYTIRTKDTQNYKCHVLLLDE